MRVTNSIICIFVFAGAGHAATPFNEVFLKATHNSYAKTSVGAIPRQLDAGCRVIELDIYDTQLATAGDFLIGHTRPGDGVHLGDGNPDTPALSGWLKLINHWSDAHPDHAPIVLYFDLKNGSGFDNGSLALLDDKVASAFGRKVFPACQYSGVWPDAESLRGRVLTVLTGGYQYRTAYRWDQGHHPAVAINNPGQVVEVHDSDGGTIWYWTGQYQKNGTVSWRHHGKLTTGINPAVALDDHGTVVEMHHDSDPSQLFYCLGKLQTNGEIIWQIPKSFSPQTRIETEFHGELPLPLIPQSRAELKDRRWISVSTGADPVAPADALHYSTPAVHDTRLVYEQRSFVECDQGDALLDRDGLLFYTAPANKGVAWGRAARKQGKIVRLWQFNHLTPAITADSPPANYPATDNPYASWYDSYLSSLHFMQ